MDLQLRWLFTIEWLEPESLPKSLEKYLKEISEKENIKIPYMGIINEANKEESDEYFDRRKIINQLIIKTNPRI